MNELTPLPFALPPLWGIGEYAEGSHWIDLPLCERIQDVCIVFFKILAASFLAGIVAFLIQPIFMIATAVGVIALIIGVAFMALSLYRIHLCCSLPSLPYPKEIPKLGEWTLNSVSIAETADDAMHLKFDLLQKAERSIEISGCYCGGLRFDKTLDIIRSRLDLCPELQVNIISNPDLLTEENWKRINTLAELYSDRFFFLESEAFSLLIPFHRLIENHTKFVIVDGIQAITGGTGICNLSQTSPLLPADTWKDWITGSHGSCATDILV